MSGLTLEAAALIRGLLTGEAKPSDRSVVTGVRTPLGQSVVATVFRKPVTTRGQTDMRLDLAETERSDRDADLAVIVSPTDFPGIDPEDAEAWNVTMTLPTLIRILGQDTTTEGTPS